MDFIMRGVMFAGVRVFVKVVMMFVWCVLVKLSCERGFVEFKTAMPMQLLLTAKRLIE
jgi:hypothetical protein